MNYKGDIVRPDAGLRRPLMVINSVTTSTNDDAVDILSADNFGEALRGHVHVMSLKKSL